MKNTSNKKSFTMLNNDKSNLIKEKIKKNYEKQINIINLEFLQLEEVILKKKNEFLSYYNKKIIELNKLVFKNPKEKFDLKSFFISRDLRDNLFKIMKNSVSIENNYTTLNKLALTQNQINNKKKDSIILSLLENEFKFWKTDRTNVDNVLTSKSKISKIKKNNWIPFKSIKYELKNEKKFTTNNKKIKKIFSSNILFNNNSNKKPNNNNNNNNNSSYYSKFINRKQKLRNSNNQNNYKSIEGDYLKKIKKYINFNKAN